MRDYLYIFSESEDSLTFSGLEFKDLHEMLDLKSLILLKHEFEYPKTDWSWNLDYCLSDALYQLTDQELYCFGDLVFVDIEDKGAFNNLTEIGLSELLYFGHQKQPLRSIVIPEIKNRYMISIHDDGWYCNIRFVDQGDRKKLLSSIKKRLEIDFDDAVLNNQALWVQNGVVITRNIDTNIDGVLNEYFKDTGKRYLCDIEDIRRFSFKNSVLQEQLIQLMAVLSVDYEIIEGEITVSQEHEEVFDDLITAVRRKRFNSYNSFIPVYPKNYQRYIDYMNKHQIDFEEEILNGKEGFSFNDEGQKRYDEWGIEAFWG